MKGKRVEEWKKMTDIGGCYELLSPVIHGNCNQQCFPGRNINEAGRAEEVLLF